MQEVDGSDLPREYFEGDSQIVFNGGREFLQTLPDFLFQLKLPGRCLWQSRFNQVMAVILPDLNDEDLNQLKLQLEGLAAGYNDSTFSFQLRVPRRRLGNLGDREEIGGRYYQRSEIILGSGYGSCHTKVGMFFSVDDVARDFFRATKYVVSADGNDWQVSGEAQDFITLADVIRFAYDVKNLSADNLAPKKSLRMLLDIAQQIHQQLFGADFSQELEQAEQEEGEVKVAEFMAGFQHEHPLSSLSPREKRPQA